jgi:3-dehydroquinate dehydratase type I
MAEKAASAFAMGTDLVEFRLDLLQRPSLDAAGELAHLARKSVFTLRPKDEGGGFKGSQRERLALISGLSELRPLYIDIELRAAESNAGWLGGLPRTSHKIVSWHDLAETPVFSVMKQVRDRAGSLGDIAKIVTMARTGEDNLRVLRLHEEDPRNLIAFCMGEAGIVSRLVSLQMGAPIIYASLPNEPVAPGQLSVTAVTRLKKMWEAGR